MKTRPAFLATLFFASSALAQAQPPGVPRPRNQPQAATPTGPAVERPAPTSATAADDKIVTTAHTTRIDGVEIRYTATTGTLVLRHASGKPRGHFFFVAYTREGQDAATRPVTFSYNGGPGSPSIWLHMGLMGPKRVRMAAE